MKPSVLISMPRWPVMLSAMRLGSPMQAVSRPSTLSMSLHFRRNGEVAGVYAVVRDITTVKQAEVDFLELI